MAYRKKMNRSYSKKNFRKGAKVRKVNTRRPMRGGIRL